MTGAHAPNHPGVEGLKAGLKDLGLEEGRDVQFDIRFTKGNYGAMPAAAVALVDAGADLIFASSSVAVKAAQSASKTVPIVFVNVGDPVAAGIVTSIARPGGQVTGVSSMVSELTPKRLEILKKMMPSLRRVWAIYSAEAPEFRVAARKAKEVSPSLGLDFVERPVHTAEGAAEVLKLVQEGDALLAPERTMLNIPAQMLQTSRSAKVPVIFAAAFWTTYGGLVSYGTDYYAMGRQAARLVAKILEGTRPEDLPVEGAKKIELTINRKTAKQLGITIPPSILYRADKVIR